MLADYSSDLTKRSGQRTADLDIVPFLCEVPIEQVVREGDDDGVPVSIVHPDSKTAAAFTAVAPHVASGIAAEAIRKPRKPVIMLKSMPGLTVSRRPLAGELCSCGWRGGTVVRRPRVTGLP